MGTAVPRAQGDLQHQAPMASRDEVLARYRRLREIGKLHHSNAMAFVAGDAILQHGRRLGLARGRSFVLDHMDELTLAVDLAVYTAPAGRSRAIDRYAGAASFPQDSDEAMVLKAKCESRFGIVVVQGRHPVAGLLVTDAFRDADIWLLDIGLEQSMPDGAMFATRYYQPAEFAMTAGVSVPVDATLLSMAMASAPALLRMSPVATLEDRRFAEAVYRAALAEGMMEGVRYRDPEGDVA